MRNILVVDDDSSICTSVRAWLESEGYFVVTADGSEAGLAALEHSKFQAMIVDIFMPGMNGFESIRIFHQRAPKVPLIAISGYVFAAVQSPAPDFLRMALELGASRCLRKPFGPAALLGLVQDCLDETGSNFAALSA